MAWSDFLWGIAETVSGALPFGSTITKTLKWGVGAYKDLRAGVDLSNKLGELSQNIGDVRKGLDEAKLEIETQGKQLQGAIDGVKSELEGQLKQQGEKFDKEVKNLDAKIAQAQGETKRELEAQKKAMAQQKQELESKIQEVTKNLTKAQDELKKDLDDFKNEVNERFENQEKKILDNKRKIEEEKRQREEEIKEVKDKIQVTNANLENLRQEKEELQEDFRKHQFQTTQQLAETQQELADSKEEFQDQIKLQEVKFQQELKDTEEELEFQTTNLNAKISTTQEILTEQEEELAEVKYETQKLNLQNQEIIEEIQETNDILFAQQRKLNLVSQQMEDIQEEVHLRMDKLSQKLEERTNQTLNLAKEANQKVNQLTSEVKNIRQELTSLEEQIQKNKEETEQARKEAQLTNERLDSLLKLQALSDYSAEQSKIDKIQKSLELKAEETKLLATLNLLKETKKLIHSQVKDKEWLVGITKGTETEKQGPEGFLLDPNSSWAKNYTPEQLAEWGWDSRLIGEHETAHLTSEERPESQIEQVHSKEQEGEEEVSANEQAQKMLEQVNETQRKVLEQLQNVQEQIQHQIHAIEQPSSAPPPPKSSTAYEFKVISAQSKVELKKKKLKQAQQEEKAAQKRVQNQPTKKNKEFFQEAQQETKQAEKELVRAEEQLQSLEERAEFDQELEKFEENIQQEKQEEVINQWQEIQALSQQVLEEQKLEEPKEEELDKKLEELAQQLNESEQAMAASQKTMTKWMLFLIIFLLEYVVYKKNGVLGLIILNVILAICYYKKDEIMKYYDLWEKYFLIIGYVLGNVMAYNSVENPDQKWPIVIGYNAIIFGIYGYTYWQQQQEKANSQANFQAKTHQIRQEYNISEEEWKTIENTSQIQDNTLLGQLNNYNLFSNNSTQIQTQQLANLKQVIETKEELKKQEEYVQKQAETLEKTTKINEQLAQAQSDLTTSSPMTWQKIKERYPEFANRSILLKELQKADKILQKNPQEQQINRNLLLKLTKLSALTAEEIQLLSHLYLTPNQFLAISLQTKYLTEEEKALLPNIYQQLTMPQKLQLLNLGLQSLGIAEIEQKINLLELNHLLEQEKANFDLTLDEKENILRLFINAFSFTPEQQQSLENIGVSFFNATNWQIDEQQKKHLLKVGLARVEFSESERQNLTKSKAQLSVKNETILQALAPLQKGYKYSANSLAKLRELKLKNNHLNFFINHQILPDPNHDFGEPKNPYLDLKRTVCEQESNRLFQAQKQTERTISKQQTSEIRKSLLPSLLEFADDNLPDLTSYEYRLSKETFQEEDDWVSMGAITSQQRDLLFLSGFKLIPYYNFFDLLFFVVENIEVNSFESFLAEHDYLEDEWKYLEILAKRRNEELRRKNQILTNLSQKVSASVNHSASITSLEEKYERLSDAYEKIRTFIEEKETFLAVPELFPSEEELTPLTSRYDDLLTNLSSEEDQRQKRKKVREEAKKKLQEDELARRQTNLSEKDRKLQEEAERREREKELQEQETEKREQARLAREQTLREEQEAFLTNQAKQMADKQKAREESFQNQKRETELRETKKKADIEALDQQNKLNQEQLEKDKKLLEEETKKKLAKITLDDQVARQKILEQQQKEQLALEQTTREREQELEREKMKKNNELAKLQADNKANLAQAKSDLENQKKQEEVEWEAQRQAAELAKETAKLEEEKTRRTRNQMFKEESIQKEITDLIMKHQPTDDDMKTGSYLDGRPVEYKTDKRWSEFRGEFIYPFWRLERYWEVYPEMKINIHRWFKTETIQSHVRNTDGSVWTPGIREQKITRLVTVLSDSWYNKGELEAQIKTVKNDFLND